MLYTSLPLVIIETSDEGLRIVDVKWISSKTIPVIRKFPEVVEA